jgi:hypothetical protein
MKNIHLLPTEKPSRLYKSKITQNIFIGDDISQHGDATYNLNIYITSDEEIKEGDWCYQVELNDGKIDKCYDVTLYHTWTNNGVDKKIKYKKIILTTDQDLINDGVQAIDDEFLEWFVKNPSCEEVVVKHFGTCCGNQSITQCINCEKYNPIYKITIPQEEPKQETLEEAAKRTYQKGLQDDIDLSFYDGVRLGANYQAERMYSEVFEWLSSKDYLSDKMEFIQKEFEQFKKK